jgi:ribonucleoside-diphosphate reductase alpha chain
MIDKNLIKLDQTRNSLFKEISLKTLATGYLQAGEGPQEALARASAAFADDLDHAQRLYDAASQHWFMFSTPILANGGTEKGLGISCFLQNVQDSIGGISKHYNESIFLTINGGGLGGYWGNLRTSGEGSKSNGMIPFMKVMDSLMLAGNQTDTRRGAYAAYLDVSHPEIEEFIDIRDPNGDHNRRCLGLGFHHSVVIDDKFMDAVKSKGDYDLIDPHTKQVKKTVKALDIWKKILNTRRKLGEPYLMFKDTANYYLPINLAKKGLVVAQSNLCLAPETKILTKEFGYKEISKLSDKSVNVWNGKEWCSVTPTKTGTDREVITLKFSNGAAFDVTPNHKFFVVEDYGGEYVEVEAKDLLVGDKLVKFSNPIPQDHNINLTTAYVNGFYSADGCFYNDTQMVYLYGEKKTLLQRILNEAEPVSINLDSGGDRHIVKYKNTLMEKFFVPQGNWSIRTKVEWLAGLLDGDGTVARNGKTQSLQVASTNNQFLTDIRHMLGELGVSAKVRFTREAGKYNLPDGKGGLKAFDCEPVWRLLITEAGVQQLLSLGLNCSRLVIETRTPNREASQFVKVEAIENNGRKTDTFCLTEPKEHKFVADGILVSNCNEIFLPTGVDYAGNNRTAICCLSSLNIAKFDDWKDHAPQLIEDLVRMLDNVITHFIENAPPEAKQAIYAAMMTRDIGLGAMGFHHYLQTKMIPYESSAASDINSNVFYIISKYANAASIKLGDEKGPYLDAYGPDGEVQDRSRNAHKLALAPNASSGIICGNTSPQCELYHANAFKHTNNSGSFLSKNPVLEQLLNEKGYNTDDVWKSIIGAEGSVQHLDCLTDDEKLVFKTAFEVDQMWVVEHYASRQPYICQGQSLNLYWDDPSPKELHEVHMSIYDKKLKGAYYLRSRAKKSNERISIVKSRETVDPTMISCAMCQG